MLNTLFEPKGSNITNFILACDSYKIGHIQQRPKDMVRVHVSMVPRKGFEDINEVVVMGPQIVAKILSHIVITDEMIDEAEKEINAHGGDFPRKDWEYIRDLGYFPLSIRAVPEGCVVPVKMPIMTIENTDTQSSWLPGYIETWVQDIVWTMTTIASKLRPLYFKLQEFCKISGTDPVWASWMVHNFGDRGAGGQDRVIMAGIAHAVFFNGSDCLRANRYIKKYYGTDKDYLSSLDASEHYTMCANSECDNKNDFGGFEMSLEMLKRAVERANRGIGIPVISSLIDTFDDERYVKEFVIGYYDEISAIGGKYVCRPDSGDAIEKPIQVIDWLLLGLKDVWYMDIDSFKNEKGFYQLPDNLGVIQGDGLKFKDINTIIDRMIEEKYAAGNLVTGFGGGLTNGSGRDDFSFSMKATAMQLASGQWIDLQKAPASDPRKASLKGRVTAGRNKATKEYIVERVELINHSHSYEDIMITIFLDQFNTTIPFDIVRECATK